MKEKKVQDILEMSQTFASGKRLLLLFVLKNEPLGYTAITKHFNSLGVPIGSSEVYKHLNHLMDQGYVVKKSNSYLLTLKGLKAVENAVDIIDTPPKIPEVRLSFKETNK